MHIFQEFSITFDPQNLQKLSRQISSIPNNEIETDDQIQIESVAGMVNLIQQNSIINNEDLAKITAKQAQPERLESIRNIYGKAANIRSNKAEIAEDYKENSDKDAHRSHIKIQLDNKDPILIQDLQEQTIKLYNEKYKENKQGDEVTIDMIVDFIQSEYKVGISDRQRNFLRSQWNQSGLTGAAETIVDPGISSYLKEPFAAKNNKTEIYIFKNGNLDSVKTILEKNGVGTFEGKSGLTTVTADLSNLIDPNHSLSKKEIPNDKYLPLHDAKSISISYKSENGLNCAIHTDILNAFKENSNFEGKDLTKKHDFFGEFILSFLQFFTLVKDFFNKFTSKPGSIISSANNTSEHLEETKIDNEQIAQSKKETIISRDNNTSENLKKIKLGKKIVYPLTEVTKTSTIYTRKPKPRRKSTAKRKFLEP